MQDILMIYNLVDALPLTFKSAVDRFPPSWPSVPVIRLHSLPHSYTSFLCQYACRGICKKPEPERRRDRKGEGKRQTL